MSTWVIFSLLSAAFAALVSILAKIGLADVNSNLATAIRTTVILVFAWGIVWLTNAQKDLVHIDRRALIFLILSGLATGASWLFYFHALQKGPTAAVAVIDKLSVALVVILSFFILGEPLTLKSILATLLVVAGCVLMVF